MFFRICADLLLIIHLLFIMFVIGGGFLVIRKRYVLFIHLPAALWGTLIEFYGWICPLTPWENKLRHMGGQSSYTDSFIEHYLLPLIYPLELSSKTQIYLGLFVIIINIIAYGWVLIRALKKQ